MDSEWKEKLDKMNKETRQRQVDMMNRWIREWKRWKLEEAKEEGLDTPLELKDYLIVRAIISSDSHCSNCCG